MDIITVFGTVVAGSNPAGCTSNLKSSFMSFWAGFEKVEYIAKRYETYTVPVRKESTMVAEIFELRRGSYL